MDPADLLAKNDISLKNTAPGRHYTTCPRCSAERSNAHKRAECLGVTIEGNGSVRWGCNHCNWSGPERGNGAAKADLISYVYRDRNGTILFRKLRNLPGREPRFWLQKPDGNGGWVKGTGGVDTKIVYRADEVDEAIAAGRIIACAEGEKDANNLCRLGFAATCNAHGASESGKKAKWTEAHSEQLRGADLVVFNDNDAAGYAHADATCRLSVGLARRIRRLDLARHWPEIPKGGDVSDWLAAGHGAEELAALIEAAPDYVPAEPMTETAQASEPATATQSETDDDAELTRLAKLPRLEYERARKAAAEALGARASMLDRVVDAKRKELGLDDDDDGVQGKAVSFPEPEPWPDPIDGATLLNEVADTIRRYVVLADHMRDIAALWAIHTYIFQSYRISPKLSIRSPTKGCGKSTLLEVLAALVNRSLQGSNITPAALFRVIAKYRPTLLIDEADTFVGDNIELRGVLNATHKHDGHVIRTVGDDHEPRAFSVFAPLAFAGIGTLPGTLTDRSITVELQRRLRSEKLEQLRAGQTEPFAQITRRIVRWLADNAMRIVATNPALPECLQNRLADNWLPLLAIAEVAGGDWKERAHKAAQAVLGDDNEEGRLELLLAHIRDAFAGDKVDRLGSADLIEILCANPERPWGEYGRSGRPLTQAKLARLLKPLAIPAQVLRIGDKTPRGYYLHQFNEAFERFLPPEGASKAQQRNKADEIRTSEHFQSETAGNHVEAPKSEKPANDGPCCGVALSEGGPEQEGPADHVCAQCHGEPPDGQERPVSVRGETVWLHPECERFFKRDACGK